MRKLVLATRNQGKVKEMQKLLEGLSFEIVMHADYQNIPDVMEDGNTFSENAIKKARHFAKLTGEWALADDSGLEVDALEGQPGVYSARFAGQTATDQQNNEKLLAELADTPEQKRSARFRCVLALCTGDKVYTADGECEGIITFSPFGTNGFGYDPLFFLPQYGKTMAEINMDLKNIISHRAKALQKMKEIITELTTKPYGNRRE